MKRLRLFLGYPFMKIGSKMWQRAFDRGAADNYCDLTLIEKIGYHIFISGLIISGFNGIKNRINY